MFRDRHLEKRVQDHIDLYHDDVRALQNKIHDLSANIERIEKENELLKALLRYKLSPVLPRLKPRLVPRYTYRASIDLGRVVRSCSTDPVKIDEYDLREDQKDEEN